jgi:hypothetical protein
MSSVDHIPTNLPVPDAPLQPMGYAVGVHFHEPLKLLPQTGLVFATKLADYVDPRGVIVKDDAWIFSQPLVGESAASSLQVVVRPATVELEARYPADSLEWFETRYRDILKVFCGAFHPSWLLASSAKVFGTIPIDGDARAFLCEHVAKMNDRLGPLGRPVHLFGIRIALPACELRGPSKGKKPGKLLNRFDWMLELKVESLFADPTKVYLEAVGEWQAESPKPWSEATIQEVIGHLAILSLYVKDNLIPFLTAKPRIEGE